MKLQLKSEVVIADYSQPYIIAEIGANHNGDMDLARHIIKVAKECGCDAVKFQSWTPDSLVAKEEYDRNQKYEDSPKKHFGSLRDMVEKYYLREDQHWELKRYCDNIGIEFCSTPFSKEEANLLEEMKVPFYKVASMDINNLGFLSHVARKQKPILLSTGMATLAEIENAIRTIEAEGNSQIILLHCISIYPPAYEDINLNNIPMLRQAFGFPVGFSDHTIGISIPLVSVALGSCLIEKHFTLDKNMPGWDHEISANPDEMKAIVEESRNIIKALGSFRRVVSQAEEGKKLKFRRSIVASTHLEKGHEIIPTDLIFKRPGTGIPPDRLDCILGRKVNKDVKAGELLKWGDLL
ncbi:MAG: polysaccharide biosynthesis protein [Gammaproteobacteria bacterium GWF2_41_13]|nr:MAG: polysaccharide biosynthesis protein [Gammaproteobacteria bacterium GWF2_41_13]